MTPQLGVVMTTSTPTIHDPVTVTYTPNGDAKYNLAFPPGPSLVVNPEGALPCGASVTVELNPMKVRSHDQQTAFKPKDDSVSGKLTMNTEPFTATLTVPVPNTDPDAGTVSTTVPAESVATVQFNTLVPDAIADAIKVSVTKGNATLSGFGVPMRDAADPTLWNVSPPDTGWPAGIVVRIEVSADAADTYDTKLGAAVSGSFEVAP